MLFLKDRRTLMLLAGGLLAIVLGIGGAMLLRAQPTSSEPPPASRAGLVIEMGRADDTAIGPNRQLRCFVGGQFIGELTLTECARRNGVATGALDVGIDTSGALAGSRGTGPSITPLPPRTPPTPSAAAPVAQTTPTPVVQGRACLRYASGTWRRLARGTLNDCVQAAFAGRCVRPGEADYGRWGEQTIRLVPGRVEISDDNHSFRTLLELPDSACSGPQPG
jgi:hypothetical protein